MCGIAGWVDQELDLRLHENTVRTMVATLANRGPDAEGVWTCPEAGLGYRRLSVIDPAGGAQPFLARQDGRTVAALVYNGEVYNFRRLRRELAARGHSFATDSDTEVVLRSYLEWGAACAEHLDGMFAFAVWDVRLRRLLLARDRLGVKPLYYARVGAGVVFGSKVKALLAHPLVPAAVDAEGMAELLAYVATPGHGVYRNVHQVRPGHVVLVGDGLVRERSYWSLPGHDHPDDLGTTVDTVRGLLAESVTDHLVADAPLCTMLSGGLDSSAIAAFVTATGQPARTVTVDFDKHDDTAGRDIWHGEPDAPYAAEVARHLGTDHHQLTLTAADLDDPVVDDTALRAQDLPRPIPDMDRTLLLLLRAVRQHSTVVLMGEVADELFGGYQSFHHPTWSRPGNFPWVTMNLEIRPNGMGTGLLDPALLARVDVPGYARQRYAEAMADVPVVPGEPERERALRGIGYLHLTRWLPLLLARDDQLSMSVGLEVRVPFAAHRLVEYVFNIPWALKTAEGAGKGVLRAAVRSLLPASVLRRAKSPFPVIQDSGYGRTLRERLAAVVADRNSPVQPLLDRAAVAGLLRRDRQLESTGWGERRDVEMVLQLDKWLRRYRVRLDV